MLGKEKERFIEVEIKKGKKVNKRSKICFVHFILSRIVWKTTWEKTDNLWPIKLVNELLH